MRFPWLQVDSDFIRCRAPDAAVVLGVPTPQVIGHLLMLWEWVLSRSPDDAPPTGAVDGPHAATLIERAAMWGGSAGALVECLCDSGVRLMEKTTTGYRVRGLERYAETWAKQEKERQRWHERRERWKNTGSLNHPSHSSGAPAEHRALDSAPTPAEHQRSTSRKTEIETETDIKEDLFPGRAPAQPATEKEGARNGRKRSAKPRSDSTPADPRHAPLSIAMVALGWPHHGGRTAKALKELLALADQSPSSAGNKAQAEILRRAAKAKAATGFPQVREIHELATHWGHFAGPSTPLSSALPKADDPDWVTV
jgi:hypothetical protein